MCACVPWPRLRASCSVRYSPFPSLRHSPRSFLVFCLSLRDLLAASSARRRPARPPAVSVPAGTVLAYASHAATYDESPKEAAAQQRLAAVLRGGPPQSCVAPAPDETRRAWQRRTRCMEMPEQNPPERKEQMDLAWARLMTQEHLSLE
jgi:hypothetical protein